MTESGPKLWQILAGEVHRSQGESRRFVRYFQMEGVRIDQFGDEKRIGQEDSARRV